MTDNISITIKNFKSYQEATLPLAPLTLLIGANASGKSNAIEAFRFLSWVAGGERLSTLKNRVNDSDKIIRGTVNDLVFRELKDFALSIQYKNSEYENIFHISNNVLFFENEDFKREDTRLRFTNYTEKPNHTPDFSVFRRQEFKKDNSIISNLKEDFSHIFLLANDYKPHKKLEESQNFTEDFFQEIEQLRFNLVNTNFFDFSPNQMRSESLSEKELRQNGQNLAGVLHYLCEKSDHASQNKTKLLALIKSLPEQNIIDIKFYIDYRDRVEFALIENFGDTPEKFPMDLLSDGTLKVLAIATALLSVPIGSTLVIEEIDNSIHPSRANDILSLMRQYAEERDLKLLLSTHNPALMDAIPDEALADVVFCYRDPKQGDSRLVRLGDLDDFVGLVVQGSLGDLVTQGVVERFVKHPTTDEAYKEKALAWLEAFEKGV